MKAALGIALGVGLVAATACSEPAIIPDPDLSAMEPLVVRVLTASREAVQADPGVAEAWGRLGAAYQAHGMRDEAAGCYREARRLAPSEFRWAYFLAVARAEAGAPPEESARLFDEAAALQEDYAPLEARRGQMWLGYGRLAEARAAFTRAIALDPTLAVAQRGLGQAWIGEEDLEKAVAPLERAAELRAEDGAVWAALAMVYGRTGRLEDARVAAARSRRLRPIPGVADPLYGRHVESMGASARHWFERARARLARGELDAALDDLATVRQTRPDDPDTLFLTALARWGLGETAEAEAAFRRALEINPVHVGSHVELARLLTKEGRSSEGLEHLRRARELAPADPDVLAALGSALAGAGETDGAIEVFGNLASVLPDDARVQLNLGSLLGSKGDFDASEEHLRRAIELAPRYAEAHRRLAILLERRGRTEEARTHRETAAGIDGGD